MACSNLKHVTLNMLTAYPGRWQARLNTKGSVAIEISALVLSVLALLGSEHYNEFTEGRSWHKDVQVEQVLTQSPVNPAILPREHQWGILGHADLASSIESSVYPPSGVGHGNGMGRVCGDWHGRFRPRKPSE